MSHRIETDSFGEVQVPHEAYWGAQTQRSLHYFNIGNEKFSSNFIHSYAIVKKAAALANSELGELKQELSHLIKQAADEIIAGKLPAQFPLSVWQTGSGTQTNMNLNEVIANRANEIAGQARGTKSPVHPNDHVNCGQSTNDTFPTAMHVATVLALHNELLPAISTLKSVLAAKSHAFARVVKMGRTHLQDATPLTLGQEISGWVAQLELAEEFVISSGSSLCALAAGGTAVGTGLNTHPKFAERIAHHIAQITGYKFFSAPNKFAALAGHEPLVWLCGALNSLACALMKIANDTRWLASGPRGGLGEISIAENEPGSSIMPGKVNPTQAEALSMICCQVMGNSSAATFASSQGNFELNVFKPVIIHNTLQSIQLLAQAMLSFSAHCAESIQPIQSRLDELQSRSLMLVTALTPHIGYDMAAKIAKKAHHDNSTLKEAALSLKALSEHDFDAWMRPETMVNLDR